MNKVNYLYVVLFLLAVLLIISAPAAAQVYTGNLLLKSQAEIDAFNYTSVTGELNITEEDSGNITNLDGLSELTNIGDRLNINYNSMLTDISGLSNLNYVGNVLQIYQNASLENLNGLSGLVDLPNLSINIAENNSLLNLNGLSNLVNAWQVTITYNLALTSVEGLSSLTSLTYLNLIGLNGITTLNGLSSVASLESFRLENNLALTDFNALSNITSLVNFDLVGNISLVNMNGLSNLTHVTFLNITGNNSLIDLSELSGLNEVSSTLTIADNTNLVNLNGLQNVDSLPGGFLISANSSLTSLEGLNGLRFVSYLQIFMNPMLPSLDGLSGLLFTGSLYIDGNGSLSDLDALYNLSQVGDQVIVINNPNLSRFCGLYTIMLNFDPIHQLLYISGNAENPTQQEIIDDGPCMDLTKSFIMVLNGETVEPPVETEASGGGMFILNTNRDTLQYWIRVCDFRCPLTSARFHIGQNFEPAVKNITSSFVQDTAGNLFASGLWTASDATDPLTHVIANYLVEGFIYLNISSSVYPSGEVRGFITSDTPVHLYANLDGGQEVPPVFTSASGEGHFILSGDGDSLSYEVTAHNLSGPVAAAHFHREAFGVPGPVVKPISFTGDSISTGVWANTDAAPLTPSLVADLMGCYLYVNVHTPDHPSGEIRGQIYKSDEIEMDYITMLAARNDANPDNNSLLSLYSLEEGKTFERQEGQIIGYNGKKNIVDLAVDAGGNIYFVNNTWASILYKVKPKQLDFDSATPVRTKQIGKLRTYPDETLVNISRIRFIKGKLYGLDEKANKLYDINQYNGYVKEIFNLNASAGKISGFTSAADGNVYLLKSPGNGTSELWKFNGFPSATLQLVTTINSPYSIESVSGHPNGKLYAAGKELYELNLANKTLGVLKNHPVDIAAMDFNYYMEAKKDASASVAFETLTQLTDVKTFSGIPTVYKLEQNYPNPFNPSTVIKYSLPQGSFVKLNIYNSLGELIKTLVNTNLDAGEYETVFDASGLASGMYIYKIEAGSFSSSAKMLLLK